MHDDHPNPAEERSLGLPPDAEARVIKEARKEGVFAGLTGGLASAVLGARLSHRKVSVFGNKTIICGILSGVLSGYLFTQAFRSTALAQLHAEEARRHKEVQQASEIEAVVNPSSSSAPN